MTLKEMVYHEFNNILSGKIKGVMQSLSDLKDTGANETKSTAGDKHETALAMIQIEQDNKRRQLAELQLQSEVFKKIDPTKKSKKITVGSLVETDSNWFYLSTALGKILFNGKTIYAISATSPLGLALIDRNIGDSVALNNMMYRIVTIH